MEMGLEHQGTANTTAPSHEGLCPPLGISYSYAQLGSYMLKSAQRARYLSASPLLSAQWPSITKLLWFAWISCFCSERMTCLQAQIWMRNFLNVFLPFSFLSSFFPASSSNCRWILQIVTGVKLSKRPILHFTLKHSLGLNRVVRVRNILCQRHLQGLFCHELVKLHSRVWDCEIFGELWYVVVCGLKSCPMVLLVGWFGDMA